MSAAFVTRLCAMLAFLSLASGQLCSPNPCMNQGTCVPLHEEQRFKCNCLFGFSGPTCEEASRCTFKHIVQGKEDTSDIDIVKLSGLNLTQIDECKQKCHDTPGCRAVEVKTSGCNVYQMVPLSVPDIVVMTSETGRVFAIRRCFKRKTPSSGSEPQEDSKAMEGTAAAASEEKADSVPVKEDTAQSSSEDKSRRRKPEDARTEL